MEDVEFTEIAETPIIKRPTTLVVARVYGWNVDGLRLPRSQVGREGYGSRKEIAKAIVEATGLNYRTAHRLCQLRPGQGLTVGGTLVFRRTPTSGLEYCRATDAQRYPALIGAGEIRLSGHVTQCPL